MKFTTLLLVSAVSAIPLDVLKRGHIVHELAEHPIGLTGTWERGTTNMVKETMKVADVDRDADHSP